jgi:hypothetical protein
MQIETNTTGMPAGLTVAADREGRDHCVVVVKGTFAVGRDGETRPAEVQEPLVYADVHLGDPASSSILYECDFARNKPLADLLVNGKALSPTGRPVPELMVALEFGSIRKEIRVVGDRRWESGLLGARISEPEPFESMSLGYERAFGGSDHSHPDPRYQGTELRNPIGVGFRKNPDAKAIEGQPLPNLEHPKQSLRSWADVIAPAGFGAIGRGWQPRLALAGTYDQDWLDHRFPFLPDDFDERHFLAAPVDQQVPHPAGGEVVRCRNLSPGGLFEFALPRMDLPVVFRFRDRDAAVSPRLDTIVVEPDRRRALLVWRASVPLGRKLSALRAVLIGTRPRPQVSIRADGKRQFATLEELAAWNRSRGGPRSPRGRS